MGWFTNLLWRDETDYGTIEQVDITDTSWLMSFDEALIFLNGHDIWDDRYLHCDDYAVRYAATNLEKYLGEPTLNGFKTN